MKHKTVHDVVRQICIALYEKILHFVHHKFIKVFDISDDKSSNSGKRYLATNHRYAYNFLIQTNT